MIKMTRLSMAGAAVLAVLAVRAEAQPSAGAMPLTDMNFDMWCQEEAKLPPERCDKRLPEDDAAFTAYRDKIQNYEAQYLQQRDQTDNLNRTLLHNDPVDHPDKASKDNSASPPDVPPPK